MEIKRLKQKIILNPWLNSWDKKKIRINASIFYKGMNFISCSIHLIILRRVEVFRFLFWEKKKILSRITLQQHFGKKEFVFFELYGFLINLYDWESGLNFSYSLNFYLKSNNRNSELKKLFTKNVRQIESVKYQTIFKKNSLLFSWNSKTI